MVGAWASLYRATNSGPQNSTICASAGSIRLTAPLRCAGHPAIGPKLVVDQSNARISVPTPLAPGGKPASHFPPAYFSQIMLIDNSSKQNFAF
jgi:hypothetical protein